MLCFLLLALCMFCILIPLCWSCRWQTFAPILQAVPFLDSSICCTKAWPHETPLPALFIEDWNPIPNIYVYIIQCTPYFFLWWFQSFLISGPRFIQSWALCRAENKDLVSSAWMWSFLPMFVENAVFPPWVFCLYFCQKSGAWSYICVLCSSPLIYGLQQFFCVVRMLFSMVRICNVTWNQVWWEVVHRTFLLTRTPLVIWGFLFCLLFVFILFIYFEELSSCLARVAVLGRVGISPFSQYSSCQSMTTRGSVSISQCLPPDISEALG